MTSSSPPLTAIVLAAALVLGACGSAPPQRPAGEVTNPFLGLAYSSWLVGAPARMASPEEVEAFLALRSDAQAEAFIEEFWRRRDPQPERPGNPVRERFEARAQEADRRFSEAGYLGRRTDRGALWVLYGAPEKMEFELNPVAGEPAFEVWRYPRDTEGLDGQSARTLYRFIKRGDLTVLYQGGLTPPSHRSRPGGEPVGF